MTLHSNNNRMEKANIEDVKTQQLNGNFHTCIYSRSQKTFPVSFRFFPFAVHYRSVPFPFSCEFRVPRPPQTR